MVNDYAAYFAAYRHGWLYEFDWLKPLHNHHTVERLRAKKLKEKEAYVAWYA